jgi:hypothetical protein
VGGVVAGGLRQYGTPRAPTRPPPRCPLLDGSPYFDSAAEPFDLPDGYVIPDHPPPSPANGRACRVNNPEDCGPGAACHAARIRTIGQTAWRYASPGRCIDSESSPFVRRCNLDGSVGFQRAGLTCMGFPGEPSNLIGTALLTDPRLSYGCARRPSSRRVAGEEVAQCWFSDQTIATTPAYPIGGCATRVLPYLYGCGLGCDNCDTGFSEICMFVSPTYRTGVCLPRVPTGSRRPRSSARRRTPGSPAPAGKPACCPSATTATASPTGSAPASAPSSTSAAWSQGRHRDAYLCDETLVQ